MNRQDLCHGCSGPSADLDPAVVPRFCERPCPACADAPERAPVCFGFDAGRGYFWRCRLCMLFQEGFTTQQEARLMLSAHCRLRRVEHCVGAAIRRKRATGDSADLTPAELSQALARDPAAAWTAAPSLS